ncbi:MAG: hypothetical protein D3917_15100 [Candidatus Electrothrix sp. AX5]|uniref:Cyclic nucleotide-binding domain-containing protein n=1 Tax=Candidatus Electrothrix aarhusensis TaxID=1859131 RepID=A0A444IWK8_9BACT|nr:hypothetical protein [Candidatus Electrothrix sp. AX5]RWX45243.1 Cyclic nucleotide-binding domain-containing protein [Candidatus Electrothrix aarhusensis]
MNKYELIGQFSCVLFTVAYLVKDIIWLRAISIIGSAGFIIFNYYFPPKPIWLAIHWNSIWIAINSIHFFILIKERLFVDFTQEERELHDSLLPTLSAVEFKKILSQSKWQTLRKGEFILKKDDSLNSLMYIHKGSMNVFHGLVKTDVLKDGDFIGQLTFVTREYDSISLSAIVALEDIRIVRWSYKELHNLTDKYMSIRVALLSVLAVNMSGKLTKCFFNCKEKQLLEKNEK